MPALPQAYAIETAAQLYAGRQASLGLVLQAYLRNPLGYVVKRPHFLLLARPCRLADPDRWLTPDEPQEAWYVQMVVAGAETSGLALAAEALREMPYTLPFCCWHREWRADGGRLHVFPTDKLIRKTNLHHGLHHRPSTRAA